MGRQRNAGRAALLGVAILEGAKGMLVLLAGVGLLALVRRDLQALAGELVSHLHLNPSRGYPQIFIELAGKMTDAKLWWLATGAFAYALIRLTEAYGLWRERRWAEWLGALSAGIYLPLELYELATKPTLIHALFLLVNAAVVTILVWALLRARTRLPARPRLE